MAVRHIRPCTTLAMAQMNRKHCVPKKRSWSESKRKRVRGRRKTRRMTGMMHMKATNGAKNGGTTKEGATERAQIHGMKKSGSKKVGFFFPTFFCCLYVRARIFLFFIMATPFVFLCVIIVRCQRRVVQPERQEARSATRGNGNKVGKTQRFVGLRRYLRTPPHFIFFVPS